MLNKHLFFVITFLLTLNALTAQSNLFLDNSFTPEEMVVDFFNNTNIVTSNVVFTGSQNAFAFFDAAGTNLDIGAGIVLSSGNIATLNSPASEFGSTSNNTFGDPDLELLIINNNQDLNQSFDAAILEFDFTVLQSDSLNFNYVFGSEEYPEFTCSSFNDAFGFLVSGPGISGPYSNGAVNISTIPGSDVPVSINSINDNTFCAIAPEYYLDNENDEHVILDGTTTSLPASFYAIGGETYHVKIVVGDIADGIYDSSVFLSFEGLGSDNLLEPEAQFSVNQNGNTIEFENLTKYARSWHWDFGNAQASTLRNPEQVEYLQSGTYDIELIVENFCCTDTFTSQVVIETTSILVDVITTEPTCFGYDDGTASFQITGGTAPYNISTTPEIINGNVPAGMYDYIITDNNGDTIEGSFTLNQPEPIIASVTTTPATDTDMNGSATVISSGGILPFEYLWSNNETTPTIENIPAGEYFVTITDANGCENTVSTIVESITSVNNVTDNSFLNLFPNPVSSNLFIENNSDRQLVGLEIYNTLGQFQSLSYTIQNKLIEVRSLNELSQGVYIIKLKWEDEKVSTVRFVKN